ncbi:MAG: hypothetical protein ACRD8W_12530 [Nitrososphaeraceae archaeon]
MFDDDIISWYRRISSNLLQSRDEIKKRLETSSTMDSETRILLGYLNSESLSMLSLIFKHSTIFMMMLNNDYLKTTSFEKFVESLPNEFFIQKRQWKEEINKHRLDIDAQIETLRERLSGYDEISDFVRWEKQFREDEIKDKEDSNVE